MKGDSSWKGIVGVVDTIYEDEDYDDCDDDIDNVDADHRETCSSFPSPSPSPDLHLHSRVQSWSAATGMKPDVSIYVQGTCFNLHKGPLTSRSSYLNRQLKELSQLTLPFNITAETFLLVSDFCYGAHIPLTPYNIASLITASELLEMTSLLDSHLDQNLADITDSYFSTIIVDNRPLVLIVLNAALRLLPESETAAGLVSRCLESIDLNGNGGDNMSGLADNIMQLRPEEFIIVAESIQSKLNCHDELYLLVDLYIRDHGAEMSEEDKTEMCNRVDCDKLSPQLLIHAVQNHRLPLRFIVRAMLMEQLNTRRAILTSGNGAGSCSSVTIGSILRRDEAVREAGQIKAEMESTSMRIKGLEKEIKGMKKRLVKSEEEKTALEKQLIVERWDKRSEAAAMLREGNGRSASFHYCGTTNKVERGERGSVSFGAVSRVGEDPTKKKKKKKKKQGGKGKKTSVIGKLKSKLLGFQLIGSDCRPQP